jgi:hypothetical protein
MNLHRIHVSLGDMEDPDGVIYPLPQAPLPVLVNKVLLEPGRDQSVTHGLGMTAEPLERTGTVQPTPGGFQYLGQGLPRPQGSEGIQGLPILLPVSSWAWTGLWSWSCPGPGSSPVLGLSWSWFQSCPGPVLVLSCPGLAWSCPDLVLSWSWPGPGLSWSCPDPVMSWPGLVLS